MELEKTRPRQGSADNPCVVYSINNTSISITNPIPRLLKAADVDGYVYASLTR